MIFLNSISKLGSTLKKVSFAISQLLFYVKRKSIEILSENGNICSKYIVLIFLHEILKTI